MCFRRPTANVAIYPVGGGLTTRSIADRRAAGHGGTDTGARSCAPLALETGGRTIVGRNDIHGGSTGRPRRQRVLPDRLRRRVPTMNSSGHGASNGRAPRCLRARATGRSSATRRPRCVGRASGSAGGSDRDQSPGGFAAAQRRRTGGAAAADCHTAAAAPRRAPLLAAPTIAACTGGRSASWRSGGFRRTDTLAVRAATTALPR